LKVKLLSKDVIPYTKNKGFFPPTDFLMKFKVKSNCLSCHKGFNANTVHLYDSYLLTLCPRCGSRTFLKNEDLEVNEIKHHSNIKTIKMLSVIFVLLIVVAIGVNLIVGMLPKQPKAPTIESAISQHFAVSGSALPDSMVFLEISKQKFSAPVGKNGKFLVKLTQYNKPYKLKKKDSIKYYLILNGNRSVTLTYIVK